MFEFDERKVPEIGLQSSWGMTDGAINDVYKAGDWSFETAEGSDLGGERGAVGGGEGAGAGAQHEGLVE